MKTKIVVLCLFVLMVAAPLRGHAHPHVWTDYIVHPTFNAQGLEGFRLEWTFDEMFSMQIMEMVGLRAKSPTAEHVRKIRKEAFDNLRNHDYFIHIWIDGEKFQVGEARDFNARVEENRVIYDFFIPCVVKADTGGRHVRFQVRDPEIFVDFTMAAKDAVRIVGPPRVAVDHEIESDASEGLGGFFAPASLNLRFRTES